MLKQFIIRLILLTFFVTSIGPLPEASAQIPELPAPGVMVNPGPVFEPVQLKGILVNVKNPLRFDFLIDKDNDKIYGQPFKDEIVRLSKYFLTCLAVPENDLWVNLSPYEKDRIVPENFGTTLMGKDLLEQDYLLKQIMASLSYPENDLGKRFWERVYKKSQELYGTTQIPINTFNKVWIVPKTAQVYVEGSAAFVINSQLDVMLEADYKALAHHQSMSENGGAYSQVLRDVILPELRKEVNEGKNFAVVRQVYNAMILATWYKRHLRNSFLGKAYVGRNRVRGVDIEDKNMKEKIYRQYLRSYKKCVYNYIKEDYDPATQQTIPRKYASGGVDFVGFGSPGMVSGLYREDGHYKDLKVGLNLAMATIDVGAINSNGQMLTMPDMRMLDEKHPFETAQKKWDAVASHRRTFTAAMRVPKSWRPLLLCISLGIAGFMMSSSTAAAAEPGAQAGITAKMGTKDAITFIINQTTEYKEKIHRQEGLFNVFGFFGNTDKNDSALDGLLREKDAALELLSEGKVSLDDADVASLERVRLNGEVEGLNQKISERKENLETIEAQYKRSPTPMKGGERLVWLSKIGYSTDAFNKLLAQKNQLQASLQELANSIVPNAVSTNTPLASTNSIVPKPVIVTPPATEPEATVTPPVVNHPTTVSGNGGGTPPPPENNPSVQPTTFQPSPLTIAPTPIAVTNQPPAVTVTNPLPVAVTVTNPPSTIPPTNAFAANVPPAPLNTNSLAGNTPPLTNTNPVSPMPASPTNTLAANPTNQILGSGSLSNFAFDIPTNNLHLSDSNNGFLHISNSPLSQENTVYQVRSSNSSTPPSNNLAGSFDPSKFVKNMERHLFEETSDLPLYLGLAFLGIGLGSVSITVYNKVRKKKELVNVGKTIIKASEVGQKDTDKDLPEVTLAPAAASAGEGDLLKGELELAQKIANGTQQPFAPIAAEDETYSSDNLKVENLRWMDVGALIGGAGLSLALDGGISWGLMLSGLFVTRAVYTLSKFLHEHLHLAVGKVLFPLSSTYTKKNIMGNLSLGQWLVKFVPFTWTTRSEVYLPHANVDDAWFRNKIVASMGFVLTGVLAICAVHFIPLTYLIVPLILGSTTVLKQSIDSGDLTGSEETKRGIFGCGIKGFMIWTSLKGVTKNNLKGWLTWSFQGMGVSMARGAQQAGVAHKDIIRKKTKYKRTFMFWQNWQSIFQVKFYRFYRDMLDGLFRSFYSSLPHRLVPVYNYAKSGVLKFIAHVRFATGGKLGPDTPHPFSSPLSIRELWIYDSVKNAYRKVKRFFSVTSAFNGDNCGVRLGLPFRKKLYGQYLSFYQMRSFFSAATSKYYKGRVTIRYLKSYVNATISDDQNAPKTDYKMILRLLREKGYIDRWGYVNPRFVKLDTEALSWLQGYSDKVLNQIESALFGIPAGDAPINPLVQDIFQTQGSWWASLRYAHIMINHDSFEEAQDDILFEDQGRAVGQVFGEIFDKIEPCLTRDGYQSKDPNHVRSLNDLFVKNLQTAQKLGLVDQYEMLQLLKQMLINRMQREANAQSPSLAGQVFRSWEEKWRAQGLDVDQMRRLIVNTVVEKFFTADNVAATKEFADRSKGPFGIVFEDPIDDSLTLYQDNQDILIGYNDEAKVIAYGSDPRSLKTIGPNGEKVKYIMPLVDGEVVKLCFSPEGKVVIKSWIKNDHYIRKLKITTVGNNGEQILQALVNNDVLEEVTETEYGLRTAHATDYDFIKGIVLGAGASDADADRIWDVIQQSIHAQWIASLPQELEARTYPTDEFFGNDQKNPYWAEPPVQYTNPRRIVQEEFQHVTGILTEAQKELENPHSFNNQSTAYLAERIAETIDRKGFARLRLVGYGNSEEISKQFRNILGGLIKNNKLILDVIDANDFNKNPLKYNVLPDDIFMAVSKSGATSSTKLALRIIKKLVIPQNIFAVTSRVDSVLTTVIGQSLKPDAPFCKRMFFTGEFYPTETPVASEMLLTFQMQQWAVNLARQLAQRPQSQDRYGLLFSSNKIEELAQTITKESLRSVERETGFDASGEEINTANKNTRDIGRYLGKVAMEGWKNNRVFDLFVAGILLCPWVLLHYFVGQVDIAVLLDIFGINYLAAFGIRGAYRKLVKRPAYGRLANFGLTLSAPDFIAATQRDYISRIMTNRFASIAPGAIYAADPVKNLNTTHGSDQNRGDIILHFNLAGEGSMGTSQAAFVTTGLVEGFMPGKIQTINVNVFVPTRTKADKEDQASFKNEMELIHNTVGTIGLMAAAKKIGMEMAVTTSYDGRLFDLANTYSGAAVHSTPINPITKEAEKILSQRGKVTLDSDVPGSLFDAALLRSNFRSNAQLAKRASKFEGAYRPLRKGGIDMNSRLMHLEISGNDQPISDDGAMSVFLVKSVQPQVSQIVPVSPEMLKSLLGEGYLN